MAIVNEANSAFSIIDDFVISLGQSAKPSSSKSDWKKYKVGGYLNKSSIMKASKDLVMSFPVICSDSIQPETAAMIVKAVEHNCVTTLRMLFAATYLRGDNGQEVLRMFHKNIDNDISMDDYLAVIDNLAAGGYIDNTVDLISGKVKVKEGAIFTTPRGDKMTTSVFLREATEELKKPKQYLPDNNFSESSLSDITVDSFGNVAINEAKGKTPPNKAPGNLKYDLDDDGIIYGKGNWASKVAGDKEGNIVYNPFIGDEEHGEDYSDPLRYDFVNQAKITADYKKYQYSKERDKAVDRYNTAKLDWDKKKFGMSRADQLAAQRAQQKRDKARDELDRLRYLQQQRDAKFDMFTKQLLDTDVKKCNALVPSLIVVRYNVTDASRTNNTLVEDQFIAGVKANLYTSSTREIVEKVKDAFANSGRLAWIKATTGETNFMKDFILGIDKAKISAKNTKLSQTSPIWSHLQYRSNKSVLNRLRKNKPNDAGAITTLCITNEEVDYLNKEYNINLMDIKTAHKLMEHYNFMQLIVVDENFEVARFLMDGNKYWEDHAFSTLEREDKDNSYKKVVNLLGKVNRG